MSIAEYSADCNNQTEQPIYHLGRGEIEVLSIVPGALPGVLAVVSVQVGDLQLNQVCVTNRGRGTFVNYPSRKIGGEWQDLITITSPALHRAITDVILAAVRTMGGAQ